MRKQDQKEKAWTNTKGHERQQVRSCRELARASLHVAAGASLRLSACPSSTCMRGRLLACDRVTCTSLTSSRAQA
jgi:hypothetical protein